MSHAPTDLLNRRHTAVRQVLAARGLEALVVTSLPNVLYLTNFKGSSAIVVLSADRLVFITDFRYVTSMDAARGTGWECRDLDLVRVDTSYDEALAGVLATMPRARVGFEAAHLTVSRHRWLESRLNGDGRHSDAPALTPTEGIVEAERVRKDAYEIATLREAARRLSQVAAGVFDEVRRGRRERDVALAIDFRIRQAGFERTAFDTIVAGGPNAALPHARPGERTFTEGDLVVLDFGGVYDSYCVDLTRTVSIGPASPRAREIHAAVRAAHDRAIETVAPGIAAFAIDAAARGTLEARGLGEAFGHGTGHGLGIEVHEEPRISRRRSDESTSAAVQVGMVFTIEPGAYLPGVGGVRIEDDVLVTEEGADVLTDVMTELVEI
jgi:Xaa-Pro aminopeptidase